MGDAIAGVEKIIWETFLPRLLFRKTKTLSPVVGALSTMPVKKIRTGTPESSDVSTGEIRNLPEGERGTGSGHVGGRSILQFRPHTDTRGIKM